MDLEFGDKDAHVRGKGDGEGDGRGVFTMVLFIGEGGVWLIF